MRAKQIREELFHLTDNEIRERQRYLQHASKVLLNYVIGHAEFNKPLDFTVTYTELDSMGLLSNGHNIRVAMADLDHGHEHFTRPYFLNKDKNTSEVILSAKVYSDWKSEEIWRAVRHELIHCLDYSAYWDVDIETTNEKSTQQLKIKDADVKEILDYPFKGSMYTYLYMYNIIERFASLADIYDVIDVNKDKSEAEIMNVLENEVNGVYYRMKRCYEAFLDGMTMDMPRSQEQLRQNFPALCIYNEFVRTNLYFMPKVVNQDIYSIENFYTMSEGVFCDCRERLFKYLKQNWRMVQEATQEMIKEAMVR